MNREGIRGSRSSSDVEKFKDDELLDDTVGLWDEAYEKMPERIAVPRTPDHSQLSEHQRMTLREPTTAKNCERNW